MKIELGFIRIYITRGRMKRRDKNDKTRRNNRRRINRVKPDIYERQAGRCFVCGQPFALVELHAHHIKPVSTHPKLVADPSNIRLVCKECHQLLHTNNGKEVKS